nr:hypothetical protein [Tanacetum cinerariifolium]
MTTLAEHIIVVGAENHPSILEKLMYDAWASRISLFIKGKKDGRVMLDLIDEGPLAYPTVVGEDGQTTPKKYSELTEAQQPQDNCDGETLYEYYWRFSQLINDMHTIRMTMQQVQVNIKILNALCFSQQEASQAIVEPLRIELPFLEDQFQEDPPVDPPEVPMADNRTMAELLQAPTEGYEDTIGIPK